MKVFSFTLVTASCNTKNLNETSQLTFNKTFLINIFFFIYTYSTIGHSCNRVIHIIFFIGKKHSNIRATVDIVGKIDFLVDSIFE